jgi:uncharacterized membrane protein YeaQ/YmgE (transglycosylase-associated protein family)
MLDLVVFAVIGLFTGAAARLAYPGQEPMKVLGTMLIGMVGALAGGLISWVFWPAVEGQFSTDSLLTSVLGAVFLLVVWAFVGYGRRIAVPSKRV